MQNQGGQDKKKGQIKNKKKKQKQRKNKCTFHNVPECNSFLGPRQFVVELKNKRCKETNKIKKLQACRSVREINYLTKRWRQPFMYLSNTFEIDVCLKPFKAICVFLRAYTFINL